MFYLIYYLCIFCGTTFAWNIPRDFQDDGGPLILTPLIENGDTDKARKLSEVDPELFAGVKSYAAYITVNKTCNSNTFFWFFPVEGASLETTPWIIWLQGGPGGSSLFGLFTEIGPLQVATPDKVEKMPITWGSDYSLLFIDNPVGTGFSFSDIEGYATNEDMVGAALLNFTQQFLQVFPELRKVPLFIAGESYAGKYIPAFGHYIHNKNDSMPINLKGLAIGDGWTDPPTLLHYSEWALQVGLVDPETAAKIHHYEQLAIENWDKQNFEEFESNADRAYQELKSAAPIYDYNIIEEHDVESYYVNYLNKPTVQSALHVKKMEFKELDDDVASKLSEDIYRTVKPWLEELVEHYGVMCYSGQLDMIVAYALSVNTYRSLEWSGSQGYLNATRYSLPDPTTELTYAFIKQYGNFMDVMVRSAGHMVPTDQPSAAKQIIDMFINQFK